MADSKINQEPTDIPAPKEIQTVDSSSQENDVKNMNEFTKETNGVNLDISRAKSSSSLETYEMRRHNGPCTIDSDPFKEHTAGPIS